MHFATPSLMTRCGEGIYIDPNSFLVKIHSTSLLQGVSHSFPELFRSISHTLHSKKAILTTIRLPKLMLFLHHFSSTLVSWNALTSLPNSGLPFHGSVLPKALTDSCSQPPKPLPLLCSEGTHLTECMLQMFSGFVLFLVLFVCFLSLQLDYKPKDRIVSSSVVSFQH